MNFDFSSIYDEYNQYETIFVDLADYVLKHLEIKCDPILSVSFVSNETIHEINKAYRNIDRVTDVISFAFIDSLPSGKEFLKKEEILDLGEIYICIPRAKEQAQDYGHSEHREICFLFVHGMLHLLGYDHMTSDEEKIMFGLQEEILNNKGILR